MLFVAVLGACGACHGRRVPRDLLLGLVGLVVHGSALTFVSRAHHIGSLRCSKLQALVLYRWVSLSPRLGLVETRV